MVRRFDLRRVFPPPAVWTLLGFLSLGASVGFASIESVVGFVLAGSTAIACAVVVGWLTPRG